MRNNSDELLEFYKRELAYLRRMGAEFGEKYPKVAGRLELSAEPCPDPHIERLIESFAFLTARIQHHIESEFPQLSTALLGTLYPQFLNPIPSMTVARFEVDPAQGKLTSSHVIARHTPLFCQTEEGQACRFRTCYPVELWPVELTYAGFESTDQFDFIDTAADVALVLRLRIEAQGVSFKELEFSQLRLFLNGNRMLVNALYELLFCHVLRVAVLPEKAGHLIYLPEKTILPVGFAADEDVLPYPANAHTGYRLLHEYFTFPEKYHFFDLVHLDRNDSENYFDIFLFLDQMPRERLSINRNTFCQGCTPIINLFQKTTDPIRLDQRLSEYRLCADQRREKTTEIHSIRSVSESSDFRDDTRHLEPFFSFNHHTDKKGCQAFWYGRRKSTGRKDLPGTHMYISFTDIDFNPALPPATTVYADTLCTNRSLAEQLPAGTELQIEKAAPLSRISTLRKPTAQIDPPLQGASLWRLISHLSLNYLSLGNSDESLKALKEILRLYSFSDPADTYQQISGIRNMSCRNVTRRIGHDAWRGFCRGMEICLTFDERLYVGDSAFLMAAMLNRFFPLYASVNSFTQLKICSIQREGIWKIWPPMAGDQIVL
ncbi:MAG: type VI secretion system baseplate subunit TssF [Desulfobacterales bacterium]|nr:type VI secretion system baseplate subunit TssF [Desulfobacterales bacterium]MDD4073788.1 type VI secretion system baseplate subunit TssF [Desulfobacterales bacterium]MDD4393784.1 type VI secretion system baseplate subunit TssF [Desulfobacterales bacterium]